MHVVITGANRGIGLELTRQYLHRGDDVTAIVRMPREATELSLLERDYGRRLHIVGCDVTHDAAVAGLAQAVEGAIDVLINNAGVFGEDDGIDELEIEDVLHTLDVNAVGPLRVTRALLPKLRAGRGKRIAHITSGMGSIADNKSGGSYGYRMSKAALNMMSRNLAVELARDDIMSVVINPGWVRTDMGGSQAPTPVHESVAKLIKRIDGVTAKESGEFLDYRGHTWPF